MGTKKLTAFELYIKESTKLIHLYKQKRITWTEYEINLKELQDSIKELEKEQIKDAFYAGAFKATTDLSMLNEGVKSQLFEQYFNETYGNKESN